MKRKNRRKRTTFLRLFLPGMILPVLLTAVFGIYLSGLIRLRVYRDISKYRGQLTSEYVRNSTLTKKIPDSVMLALYTADDYQTGYALLDPAFWVEPQIESLAFTFDRDGNILNNSSTARMSILIRMTEEPDSYEWFSYDPREYDIPVLNEAIAEVLADCKSDGYMYEYDISSLYLNRETHKMVPHIINIKKFKEPFLGIQYVGEEDYQEIDSYQVTADVPPLPEGYVLTELPSRQDGTAVYPCCIQIVTGTEPELFDKVAAKYKDEIADLLSKNINAARFSDNRWEQSEEVYIEKLNLNTEEAGILTYNRMVLTGFAVWRRLYFMLGLVFSAMTLFVLTLCIIRNAKNKAQYAFEDYQRALTNNLAHDLKTPLAVIGGYTENVLQMRQDTGEEKELEYLSSIMKNVAYTDEIIRKTLQLSETEQVSKLRKTELDAAKLVHDLTEKYSAALEVRGIALHVSGSAVILADEDMFTAAAENLISNAVKYTPDGGSIRITLSRKQLAVVNDAAENVDTKHLTMPFVKGDKARSDKRSSGLGLAIAAAAAERSGFSLKLDCRGKQFTAALCF